jgi:hypothetical protein
MIVDAKRHERRGSAARRLATGTLAGFLVVAALYGLYASVAAFTPA